MSILNKLDDDNNEKLLIKKRDFTAIPERGKHFTKDYYFKDKAKNKYSSFKKATAVNTFSTDQLDFKRENVISSEAKPKVRNKKFLIKQIKEEFSDMLLDPSFDSSFFNSINAQFSDKSNIEISSLSGLPLVLYFKSVEDKLKSNNDIFDLIKVNSFIPTIQVDRSKFDGSMLKSYELINESLKKVNEILVSLNKLTKQILNSFPEIEIATKTTK